MLSASPAPSLIEDIAPWAITPCGFGSDITCHSDNWDQSLLRAPPPAWTLESMFLDELFLAAKVSRLDPACSLPSRDCGDRV